MATVSESQGWYVVMINGKTLGQFGALLDANLFALQLIERGLADRVTLPSGAVIH